MGMIGNWLESLDYKFKVTDGCVKEKSTRATCSKCTDACPIEGAMALQDGKPSIDTEKCTECGLCMMACPVQAIEGVFPKRNFLDNQLIVQEQERYSVKELLIYRAKGLTSIVLTEKTDTEWPDKIAETNRMLAQLGKQPYTVKESSEPMTEEEAYTRRELFTFWGKEGKSLVREVTPARWRFNHSSLNLASYYPDSQFYEPVIESETCSLCKACEALCPKNCFTIMEESFAISPQSCTGCRLCTDTCPEQAITLEREIKNAGTHALELFKKTCADCEQPFQTLQQNDEKCPTCKNRKEGYLRSNIC